MRNGGSPQLYNILEKAIYRLVGKSIPSIPTNFSIALSEYITVDLNKVLTENCGYILHFCVFLCCKK